MRASSIKRQTLTTAVIAVVTVVLIIMYFAVLSPILNNVAEVSDAPKLLEGESLGAGNRIFMYDYMDKDSVKAVSVTNENADYAISLSEDGNYYIDGNKNAPYDTNLFTSLCVSVGYSLSMKRIVPSSDDGNEPGYIDFSLYGLDEENAPAHYTVTNKKDESYTVWIGKEITSEQGYYARLEGRNAVYIIGNDIQNTVLCPLENIITPILAFPTSSQTYYETDYFSLWRNGEHFITVHYLSSKEEYDKYAAETKYVMAYHCGIDSSDVTEAQSASELKGIVGTDLLEYNYTPAIDEYADVLQELISFKGTKTVKVIEPILEDATNEELALYAKNVSDTLNEYGIDYSKPAHELFFNYNGVNNYVIFSEKNEDGIYYAFSYTFGLIVEVSSDTVGFLDWSFERWVEPAFFQKNITKVAQVRLEAGDNICDFTLDHQIDANGKDNLTVKEKTSGKTIDTKEFREFFKVLLTREIRGKFEGEIPPESAHIATLTITTVGGNRSEYKFYQSSTQRACMTINGESEFYVLASGVRKMISDAQKLLSGEKIESEALN